MPGVAQRVPGGLGSQISMTFGTLTLNLLTTTIVAPPSNASKWQMGFNSAFKGLRWIFGKWDVVWIGSCLLWIGTGGGHL